MPEPGMGANNDHSRSSSTSANAFGGGSDSDSDNDRAENRTTTDRLSDSRSTMDSLRDQRSGLDDLTQNSDKANESGYPDPRNQDDWTDNNFFAGNHCYGHLSPAVAGTGPDIIDAMNQVGVHPNQVDTFVPGEPYVGDVNIPGPFGVDDVTSTAILDADGKQIGVRNETNPNHVLHPGVVERTVVDVDGNLHIETAGCGYGALGGPNIWADEVVWDEVDQHVIDQLNPNRTVASSSTFSEKTNETTRTDVFYDGTFEHTTIDHDDGTVTTRSYEPDASFTGLHTTTVTTRDVQDANSPRTEVRTDIDGTQTTTVISPTGGRYTASDTSSQDSDSDSNDNFTAQATQPTQNSDGTVTSPTGGTYSASTNDSGGSDSGGGGRVICTHFYKQGMLDREVWRSDLTFTANNLPEATVRGYQYWAIPYVKLMRRSALAERIMFPLAVHRANELAFQMGKRDKCSYRGKLIRMVLEPICFAIGTFVEQRDWTHLWVTRAPELVPVKFKR